jgi:hypothetical protein
MDDKECSRKDTHGDPIGGTRSRLTGASRVRLQERSSVNRLPSDQGRRRACGRCWPWPPHVKALCIANSASAVMYTTSIDNWCQELAAKICHHLCFQEVRRAASSSNSERAPRCKQQHSERAPRCKQQQLRESAALQAAALRESAVARAHWIPRGEVIGSPVELCIENLLNVCAPLQAAATQRERRAASGSNSERTPRCKHQHSERAPRCKQQHSERAPRCQQQQLRESAAMQAAATQRERRAASSSTQRERCAAGSSNSERAPCFKHQHSERAPCCKQQHSERAPRCKQQHSERALRCT